MSAVQKSPLATLLRAQTRADHHALDHHPLLAVLIQPALAIEDYARALAALHGAYATVESRLSGFAPAQDFPARTPEIAADLSALGHRPFPVRVELPHSETPAAKLGMMYVIEGSNLGGQMIAQRLSQSLPPATPMQFFADANAGNRWERFWRFAQQHRIDPQDVQIVDAAQQTFRFFREHLDSLLSEKH